MVSDRKYQRISGMSSVSRGTATCLVVLALLPSVWSAVTITNDYQTANVRRSQYTNTEVLYEIDASSSSGGFICFLDPTHEFFSVRKLSGETKFHVDFQPKTPAEQIPVATTEVSLKGRCENLNNDSAPFSAVIYILNNEPPVVATVPGGWVDISNVPVGTTTGNIIGTVAVTDPDPTDVITFTEISADDGFEIDAGGNIKTTKNMAELDSSTATVTAEVSDGVTAPVSVTIRISLDRLNAKPVDTSVITSKDVQENAPNGEEIYTFNIPDDTLFPSLTTTLTVTPTSGQNLFKVEDKTISVVGPFDYDTTPMYQLDVTVSDGYKSSTYSITVNIIDANDPPSCGQETYIVSVLEGPNVVIKPVGFTINDASGDTHTILLNSYTSEFAIVVADPLEIHGLVPYDCETETPLPNTLTLNISVVDQLGATGTCKINLLCQDDNDETPKFVEDTYEFPVSADLSLGTSIGSVSATDDDITTDTNGKVTYSLETASPADVILVLPNGDILVNKDLTPDYGNLVTGTIKATDNGASPRDSTATFIFKWNEAPTITSLPNQDSLSEDTTAETLIHTLTTTDPEGDTVSLKVGTVTDNGPFIVKKTGNSPDEYGIYYDGLTALNTLSSEDIDIEVIAEDGKGGSSKGVFTLKLIANKLPEVGCTAGVTTQVSAPSIGTSDTVYLIPATDPNSDPISVTSVCSPDPNIFVVDSGSLSLKATAPLLGVSDTSFTCTLNINDGKHPPAEDLICDITIVLTDPNEPPVIGNDGDEKKWKELTTVGTELHKFDITDAGPVTITTNFAPASGSTFFKIDPTTFAVTLDSGLDFETMADSVYVITVVANDGYLKSTGSVTIEILDDNDPPVFSQNTYPVTLKEGEDNSVPIGLAVTDTDANDTHTFTILAPESDTFSIDGTNLINIKDLDLDVAPATDVYSLKVEADDGKGGKATATIAVTVKLANDHKPVFDPTSYQDCVVGLLTPTAEVLCSGTATDDDEGPTDSTIKYSIGASSHPGIFDVIGNRIVLANTPPAADYGKLVYVEVVATDTGTDPGPLSTAINATITWNKAPNCDAPAEVFIHENANGLTDVLASDISMSDEENDDVTGQLACSPDDGAFKVKKNDPASMSVQYAGTPTLSFNNDPLYTCTLTCSDGNGGTDEQQLLIHITKNQPPVPNCNPPMEMTANPNTQKQGAVIGSLPDGATVDPEEDTLTYTFEMTPASSYFKVGPSNGEITVTDNLAKQLAGSVEITATLHDPHDNSAECKVIITVDPLNKPPLVALVTDTILVEENTAPGADLATIPFTDDLTCFEPEGTVTAVVNTEPIDEAENFIVKVEGKEVKISTFPGKELNHEEIDTYTFFVQLNDGCLKSNFERVIKITDVNEPPEFRNGDKYSATFKETEVDVCRRLDCDGFDEDKDDIDTWEWKITGKYADNFKISGADCMLCMIKEVDLDEPKINDIKDETDLTIEVTDKGGEKATITVSTTIEEENDNDPLFEKPAYYGTVTSLDAEGKEIVDLVPNKANVDKDNLKNGEFTCETKQCDSALDGYISVGADCKVRLTSSMATGFVAGRSFKCDVRIIDNGEPQRSSETKLDIQYLLITTPPPPPTTTADPNANANANANAGANGGSGTDQALNQLANGAGSGSGALSAGAIAGIATGALAGGALLATGLVFGISKLKNHCGKSSSGKVQNTKSYKVSSAKESKMTNNRIHSSSSVKIGGMGNDPGMGQTNVRYMYP